MRLTIAVAAAVLAMVPGWAGTKGDAKGMTRMVRLNVAALAGRGEAAPELKQGDLQVLDAGKEQEITLFRVNGVKPQGLVDALKPGEISNRGADMPAQVTVVLFDLLNTKLGDQGYMRGQLLSALSKVEQANSVYVYLLTLKGLTPVEPLPEAGQDVAKEAAWTQQAAEKLDTAMQSVARLGPQSDNMLPTDRINATYASLESLLNRLAGVRGRKNLLWMTQGVPLEVGQNHPEWGIPADYSPILRQLSADMDASGVAVYPVESFGPGREASGSMLEEVQTLDEIAGLTGGQVYGDGDVGSAMRDALAAARSSYVVGYVPPASNWNGKVHKIKLRCAVSGVKLLARTQYVAHPLEAASGAEVSAAVRAAMRSPFDASEIGLRGTAVPDTKEPAKTHIAVRIRAQDLMLLEGGKKYRGEVSVTYVAYGATGDGFPSRPLPMTIDLNESQREEALKDGIEVAHDIGFGGGVKKVRVIVIDNYSDAVGSVTLPFAGAGKAGG